MEIKFKVHYSNTNKGTEIETGSSKYTNTVVSEDILINLSLKDYDAKICINGKPTETTDEYLSITGVLESIFQHNSDYEIDSSRKIL